MIFFIFSIFSATCQSTFEYLYTSPSNDILRSLIEDDNGNIYFPVENFQYAGIFKLNDEGKFLDSVSIYNPQGTCNLGELIKVDEDHFIALGHRLTDSIAQLWYVLLDNNLQVIEDKKLDSDGWIIYDFKHIINHNGNIVFIALYMSPQSNYKVCIYEITFNGTLN